MARQPLKYKITKSVVPMFISDYANSGLYLGKKVIVVGDDEQVSPETVGLKTQEISALIEQHLQGIPNNHLFNGGTPELRTCHDAP